MPIIELAKDLMQEHKGIPDINTSKELLEAFYRLMRKKLIKDGYVHFEGVGKLYLKRYEGKLKNVPATGEKVYVSDRNVVKFEATESLNKMINLGRTPSRPASV